jgi:zinc D-Ala-D-Ala carboxypeptidase
MARAAAAAGSPLAVYSAFRSYRTQVAVFGKWVRVLGAKNALLGTARPGHSEHQLGLAIDFKAKGGPLPWTYYDWSKGTTAGRWLAAHAWQYGFVMSYPVGKTKKTCYGFEPWHYRYVGRDEAAQIHSSGLTVREWLWQRQPG